MLGLMGMALLAWAVPGHAITEQEQRARLLFVTREEEAQLEAQGLLYGDAALDAYLQSVMDRLYPERHGEYRVRALRNTEFNAFAVATGDLYVYTGALLRLRNEAELAAVLGHEGGHLVGDHMYRGIVESKSVARIGSVLTLGLATTLPGLGALVNNSTMAGFSRDFEREADHTGFQRLTAAGYEPKAAAPVFERMAREVTERKIKRAPYIFADHPKLLERAQNFASDQRRRGISEDYCDGSDRRLRANQYLRQQRRSARLMLHQRHLQARCQGEATRTPDAQGRRDQQSAGDRSHRQMICRQMI